MDITPDLIKRIRAISGRDMHTCKLVASRCESPYRALAELKFYGEAAWRHPDAWERLFAGAEAEYREAHPELAAFGPADAAPPGMRR